jgi:IclR family pca regulon transcriptional regulator
MGGVYLMITLPRSEHVASLEKGLRVLQAFTRTRPQMTLSEVAALTRLTPATARRSLHTLERLGYLRRASRKFALSPRVLALGVGYLDTVKADVVLNPFVDDVVRAHGGSASVTMLDDHEVIYVAHTSTSRLPRVLPGTRCPACATSMGRVLLAYKPAERLHQSCQRALTSAPARIADADPAVLTPILSGTRRKGFAVVENELDGGLISVAVPVFAPDGRVIAAASCADAMEEVGRLELLEERLPTLRIAVRGIEEALSKSPELVASADGN